MTVSSTQTKTTYVGDGSTTVFPVPFIFFGGHELQVIETSNNIETVKSYNVDYTVAGGNGAIGTVNAIVAPSNTVTWTIRRNTDKTQLTDYTPNDPFPAETHERALDKLTAITQELQETFDRTIKLPVSSSLTLDFPVPGADEFIKYNAAGTALETSSIIGLGALAIPVSISDGGTGASTKETAIQNFNLSPLRVYKYQNFF